MSRFEVTLVVEAPDLSMAVGRLLYDGHGEANKWIRKIQFAEEASDD